VNLLDETVEVHRDPDLPKERYRSILTFARNQDLRSSSVPEIQIAIERLFG
jgi:hypothetical protein